MALFNKQPNQKRVLGKAIPIDGNAIVDQNRARNAQPGGYGRIENNTTGEVVEAYSDPMQVQTQAPTEEPYAAPAEDEMIQNPNYDEQVEAYEEMIRDGVPAESIQEPQEYYTPEEYQAIQEDISDIGLMGEDMGEMTPEDKEGFVKEWMPRLRLLEGFFKENGQEERLAQLGFGNIDEELDKISSYQQMDEMGLVADIILDELQFDPVPFYQEGILQECGAECQERQQMERAQAAEYEQSVAEDEPYEPIGDQEYQDKLTMLQEQ